jgi:hypothetical protein
MLKCDCIKNEGKNPKFVKTLPINPNLLKGDHLIINFSNPCISNNFLIKYGD